jgi:outer membrane lipoprotein-sorting protein
MLRRAFIAVLLLPPLARAADDTEALLERVRQHLADAPVQRGEFEQRKTVRGFKHPLVSRGDYLVARERGIVWRTREPFASTLVVTRERLLARQADGSVTTRLEARDEPALRAINETLFALMTTDFRVLMERFRIEGVMQGENWRLTLTPRDAALTNWITGIDIEGDRYLRQVTLREAQGDSSVLRFSAPSVSQSLTPEEEARFD